MSFKNPTAGGFNSEEIKEQLKKIEADIKANGDMLCEVLPMVRDLHASNIINSSEVKQESEIVSEVSVPLVEEKVNDVTFYDQNVIPMSAEASEGMQRVLNMNLAQINTLSSQITNLSSVVDQNASVENPIFDSPESSNNLPNDEVIPMKL